MDAMDEILEVFGFDWYARPRSRDSFKIGVDPLLRDLA